MQLAFFALSKRIDALLATMKAICVERILMMCYC